MATFKCLLHPHHVSLLDIHSIRAKLNNVGDPYYNIDMLPSHHGVLAPKFDVFEAPNRYIIIGDLPGVKPDAIEIDWLDGQTLFIRGEIATHALAEAKDTADTKVLHRERQEGKFERSFTLPSKVDPQLLERSFADGVLQITLPK